MTADPMPSPGAAVYGVIMNDQASRARMGEAALRPPYQDLPKAPAMYLKPRNTWSRSGAAIVLPRGEDQVEVAATIGLRMANDVARLGPEASDGLVDACLLAADLSLPHDSYFRPAIREKCFDGALPMVLVPGLAPAALDRLVLRTYINERLVAERSLVELLLAPIPLLTAVSQFMTLRRGDVLLLGVEYRAPIARDGDRIRVEATGLANLDFTVAAGGISA